MRPDEDLDFFERVAAEWMSRGDVCPECVTLDERRFEDFMCVRCGLRSWGVEEDENGLAGWVQVPIGGPPERAWVCPDCATREEEHADQREFLKNVERATLIATAEGREFDAHFTRRAQEIAEQIRRDEDETAQVESLLGADGEADPSRR